VTLRAPFPWFGGKSRAAGLIWDAIGNVPNYVEPFAGSLAVLLARPHAAKTETVNDLDCYLANFWRAVAADPDAVAAYADWPVNEADLLARHKWLIAQADFRERMRTDADHYDAKVAGWWVWGLCQWIGSGWCVTEAAKLPHLGDAGRGVHDYLHALAARLRRVRVACGDWSRVLGDSVTWRHGVTGIVLDPPYDEDGHSVRYSAGGGVAADVAAWAFANGDNRKLRIVLCGYDGDYAAPAGWRVVPWKAKGGYGSQGDGKGRENARRERLWLSPHCIGAADLFTSAQGAA
jgi:hypothetical protein